MVDEKVFYDDGTGKGILFIIGEVLGYNDDGELEVKRRDTGKIIRLPRNRIIKREEQ